MKATLALTFVVAAAVLVPQDAPDLVLTNGRVFTGVRAQPWAEAVAIKGERITAVDTTAAIRARAGAARVIDLGGKLAIPGINDAHAHPGAEADATTLEGPPAIQHDPTLAEVVDRLKVAVAKAPVGGWIFGSIGAAVLDDPKATRFTIDDTARDRRVMLTSWTGHGTLFNTAALRHLGVKDDETDPPGGFFRRMPDGKTITGIAHEYAEFRLRQRLSMEPPRAAQIEAFQRYATAAAGFGITSVQAMATAMPAAHAAQLLAGVELPIRIRLVDCPMTDIGEWRAPASRAAPSSPRIVVSGTKWILDGTPVERLMFTRAPYADLPGTRGRLNFPAAGLSRFLARARAANEQPLVHAVGDGAIATLLDTLDATGAHYWQRLRPRIEHADMLDRVHFDRARRVGAVVVQNPAHLMIAPVMQARIGRERTAQSEQLKSILAAGIPLALGSDGPMNPYLNLMFATINQTNPREALTLEQALLAYTHGSAFAEFQEGDKGTLAAGMFADLAVLSQDIFKAPTGTLPRTTSVLTIVGGKIVHEQR